MDKETLDGIELLRKVMLSFNIFKNNKLEEGDIVYFDDKKISQQAVRENFPIKVTRKIDKANTVIMDFDYKEAERIINLTRNNTNGWYIQYRVSKINLFHPIKYEGKKIVISQCISFNKDGMELTDEIYQNLRDMAKNHDTDTILLARLLFEVNWEPEEKIVTLFAMMDPKHLWGMNKIKKYKSQVKQFLSNYKNIR